MRPAICLALASVLFSPTATHARPESHTKARPAPAVPVILRLLAPDASRLANTEVVLSCPSGRIRMLTTDAAGLVSSGPAASLAECTLHALVGGRPHSARLDARTVEPVTLQPGTRDTKFIPFAEATPVGGPAQTAEARASASASYDSAGISLAGTSSAMMRYSMESSRATTLSWLELRDKRRARRKRRRARRTHRKAARHGTPAHGLAEAAPKPATPEPSTPEPSTPQAPPLTAGAVDDVNTPRGFHRYLKTVPIDVPLRERFAGPHRVVQVTDTLGRPVAGATVSLAGRTYRSRRDGRVVLIPGWDPIDGTQAPAPVIGGRSILAALTADVTEVVLEQAIEPPPAQVDLALVLDTTGSMGDELVYLKAELAALLTTLKSQHSRLDIRWALVVYRDDGDDYVTQHVDFMSDFEAFSRELSRHRADGGGDMPEAVDAAFATAATLDWRDAAVAGRVLVHVADAPPHMEKLEAMLLAADRLRREGTAIYPVAGSGVDGIAEFTMRTSALMSGGQYVFLTDDSGVGGPHREATAACFRVQPLITVLGKILSAELAGRRADLSGGTEGKGCKTGNG